MNNILCRKNIPKNPYFLPLISLFVSAAALLVAERAIANNSVLRSIFSCQAQGLGGAIPSITVWFQQGTNLSFIPTGETIKKVWLDDPSQVTLDFDGPMCQQFGQDNNNTGNCENSGANVIHMRRIRKLNIPGLPNTDTTLLTVVTEGQGRRNLYTFQVNYGDGDPEYRTLAVYPDAASASGASCIRPNNPPTPRVTPVQPTRNNNRPTRSNKPVIPTVDDENTPSSGTPIESPNESPRDD